MVNETNPLPNNNPEGNVDSTNEESSNVLSGNEAMPNRDDYPGREDSSKEQIERQNKELDEIRKVLKTDLREEPLNFDREINYHRNVATYCLLGAASIIIAGGWCFWKADKITSSWNEGIENYVQHRLDSLAKRDSINAQINIKQ